MGTAVKHPVPDGVKQYLLCNFRHPGTLTLRVSVRVPGCQKLKNDGLTRSGTVTRCFIAEPIWQQWTSEGLISKRTVVDDHGINTVLPFPVRLSQPVGGAAGWR